MNKITIVGNLRKDGPKDKLGYCYFLDAVRRSGTVDTLMVISQDENLPEKYVMITGQLKARRIRKVGIPVFIFPDKVEVIEHDTSENDSISEAVVTGILKADPVCGQTKSGRYISSVLLITDDGPIPVLLWGNKAKNAENEFKAGDKIQATGRFQSREYTGRDNLKHMTYELSAKNAEVV